MRAGAGAAGDGLVVAEAADDGAGGGGGAAEAEGEVVAVALGGCASVEGAEDDVGDALGLWGGRKGQWRLEMVGGGGKGVR